eukprot:scaffold77017_cov37-Tisochrysis_lutea.AAC.1
MKNKSTQTSKVPRATSLVVSSTCDVLPELELRKWASINQRHVLAACRRMISIGYRMHASVMTRCPPCMSTPTCYGNRLGNCALAISGSNGYFVSPPTDGRPSVAFFSANKRNGIDRDASCLASGHPLAPPMKPMDSVNLLAVGSKATVVIPQVHAHTAHSCVAGPRASQAGTPLKAGKMKRRLHSCMGYMATNTVAATFHDGGGGS